MKLLAIDPGHVHVGMALFEDGVCTNAWEMTPVVALEYVRVNLAEQLLDVLVIEEFRLYPWMAKQQSFDDLPTVQLIGALKYLWATCGATVFHRQGEDGEQTCVLAMQPATIKEPTRNVLRGRKIKSLAKKLKVGGHAADAELHGYHYVLRMLRH